MRFTVYIAAVIAIVTFDNPMVQAVQIPATTELELAAPTSKDRSSVAPQVHYGEDCPGPKASKTRWLYDIPKTINNGADHIRNSHT